ncbi:hypothetical protein QYF36_016223 [Acer negundo]|nr:hypothetical protein QYF36_016223 [Acer negundo]
MKLKSVDDIKEGGGKGIKSSIGNDGLDISERRSLFQKRAWGVVMELLSKKGMEGEVDRIESKTGMGSSANKFSSSSSMFSEDIRVVDSDRHGPCVVEGDLGGPAIDVFVNLRDKVSVRDEWDCNNLGVTSISATRRQGDRPDPCPNDTLTRRSSKNARGKQLTKAPQDVRIT